MKADSDLNNDLKTLMIEYSKLAGYTSEPTQDVIMASKDENIPKRILVVDDDENILSLLRTLLIKHGYAIELAQNGREGAIRFNQFKPDLVLLDINMPEIDGYELCRHLRKRDTESNGMSTKRVPIIFLTGSSSGEDVKEALGAGADSYIVKPFVPEDLTAQISRLI